MPATPARIESQPAYRSYDDVIPPPPARFLRSGRSSNARQGWVHRCGSPIPRAQVAATVSGTMDDAELLAVAIGQARVGLAEGGVPIGAAILIDGEVVAAGRNRRGPPRGARPPRRAGGPRGARALAPPRDPPAGEGP